MFGVVLLVVSACGGGDGKTLPHEDTAERCRDGVDNDRDGHLDCRDQDCAIFAFCIEPDTDSDTDTDTGSASESSSESDSGSDSGTGSGSDADTDADGDSDADTDADADTDGDLDCRSVSAGSYYCYYGYYAYDAGCADGDDYCLDEWGDPICFPYEWCAFCCPGRCYTSCF